jgi:hypothetical protein
MSYTTACTYTHKMCTHHTHVNVHTLHCTCMYNIICTECGMASFSNVYPFVCLYNVGRLHRIGTWSPGSGSTKSAMLGVQKFKQQGVKMVIRISGAADHVLREH